MARCFLINGGSGSSAALDFTALSNALTGGTLSGLSITPNEETETFNIEITGLPSITIDSEGYWNINGERGDNPTKAQGDNGISPIVSATSTETGATITITDSLGKTTVDISNGIDGVSPHIDSETGHWFIGETDTGVDATASIDDTSTDGTDVSWSASKINSVIGDINTILASVTGGIL